MKPKGQSAMRVIFRADASAVIGAGHVMRCLTLADALKDAGAACTFTSRDMPPALAALLAEKGHALAPLPSDDHTACLAILTEQKPDWLVVDHYGLDAHFERAMRPAVGHIMVIDDLADRPHDCDLLLDQNLGRSAEDYRGLVPDACRLLIGPTHALLRPDFAASRDASLKRRDAGTVHHILISMGGFDNDNVTGAVLAALTSSPLPADTRLSVVMGRDAPWIDAVRSLAATLPWPTDILVGVRDMAALMASADLAIGAAGGSAWERAALGLPAILAILADNQRPGAKALAEAGAARLLAEGRPVTETLPEALAALMQPDTLKAAIRASAAITDGRGTQRVAAALLESEAA